MLKINNRHMHFPLLCSIWTNSMTPDLPLSLSFFWSEGVPSLLITVISVLTGIILCKLNSKELCKSTRVIHVGAFSHNTDLGTCCECERTEHSDRSRGENSHYCDICVALCCAPGVSRRPGELLRIRAVHFYTFTYWLLLLREFSCPSYFIGNYYE